MFKFLFASIKIKFINNYAFLLNYCKNEIIYTKL